MLVAALTSYDPGTEPWTVLHNAADEVNAALAKEPKHDWSCAEWCNHCEVCGTAIMYGSRCHDHPNQPVA
jgi:hypothetical protein